MSEGGKFLNIWAVFFVFWGGGGWLSFCCDTVVPAQHKFVICPPLLRIMRVFEFCILQVFVLTENVCDVSANCAGFQNSYQRTVNLLFAELLLSAEQCLSWVFLAGYSSLLASELCSVRKGYSEHLPNVKHKMTSCSALKIFWDKQKALLFINLQ